MKLLMGVCMLPVSQLCRLNTPELEWDVCRRIEAHWHKHTPILTLLCFVENPFRLDRYMRPHDHDASGFLQGFPYDSIVPLAWENPRIPPYGPALLPQRMYEREHPLVILSRVAQENIIHTLCLVTTVSSLPLKGIR
jgi:hypothetical protein